MYLTPNIHHTKMRDAVTTQFWKAIGTRLLALRHSCQGLKDWLIEFSFSRFLGSAWVDYVIQQTQHLFVSSMLLQLRDLDDFFGLLRALSPALMCVCLRLSGILIKYLRKARASKCAQALVN